MTRTYKALAAAILAAALAACGGGGGSPGTNPNAPAVVTTTDTTTTDTTTTTTAQSVASIDVFTSAQSLPSANNSAVTLTVLPKDANNNALPSQQVTFSTNSGTLTGSLPTPSTGTKGEPVTGVGIGAGTDRTNRNITVTVTSGTATKQVVIPVVGSTVSLTGVSFVKQGLTSQFTARALDSAGNPVTGITLAVSSSKGNGISALTATDGVGNATFTYTATNTGADTLTVTGLGTTATTQVLVSADEFSFTVPAVVSGGPAPTVNVGANQVVTVRLLPAVLGTPVTFSTTRGTFVGGNSTIVAATDAAGNATATVTSTSAGPTTITAQTGATQVTLPLTFVAITPASVALQANPGAIPPNAAGTSTNQVALSANVRDVNGNPVAGRLVTFSAAPDPSGGTINPPTATTDAGGTATSTFFPGPTTTANNGVTLSAAVQGTAVAGTTSLTVNAQAAFISIATGNEIGNLNPTTYAKDFAITVVDVNGAPVAGKVVTLSVIPTFYTKGVLEVTGTTWGIDAATAFVCPNEDANRNGVLDAAVVGPPAVPAEDVNGDGLLQPGIPATLSVPSITTAANGVGTFTLYYGENFAPWVSVNLTARTTVGGTESVKVQAYNLVGSAPDFTTPNVPAATTSPFGVNACNVAN